MKAQAPPCFCISAIDLQRQRGLARRLRAVDFHHAATRQAADAQGDVQAQRAGGDHLDVLNDLALAQAHDGALAKLLLNLRQRCSQSLGLFGVHGQAGLVPLTSMEGLLNKTK